MNVSKIFSLASVGICTLPIIGIQARLSIFAFLVDYAPDSLRFIYLIFGMLGALSAILFTYDIVKPKSNLNIKISIGLLGISGIVLAGVIFYSLNMVYNLSSSM